MTIRRTSQSARKSSSVSGCNSTTAAVLSRAEFDRWAVRRAKANTAAGTNGSQPRRKIPQRPLAATLDTSSPARPRCPPLALAKRIGGALGAYQNPACPPISRGIIPYSGGKPPARSQCPGGSSAGPIAGEILVVGPAGRPGWTTRRFPGARGPCIMRCSPVIGASALVTERYTWGPAGFAVRSPLNSWPRRAALHRSDAGNGRSLEGRSFGRGIPGKHEGDREAA